MVFIWTGDFKSDKQRGAEYNFNVVVQQEFKNFQKYTGHLTEGKEDRIL
ncbi:MAG: hypothetical protein R3A12_01600 [Ignavibacteria bacterium]